MSVINNPAARLQRVEEGLASGHRATLHFALQRQRLPAVGGCDETEFVAFTDELSCERVERQLAVRAARNCAKVGIRSVRNPYGQWRAGNVVRFLRRSQPGVSGVRRRAGRAGLRGAYGQPRRAVLDRARIQGVLRPARHVLPHRPVRQGVGLSDPVPKVRTLDDRAAEIEAVMDAAGFVKAVVFGISDGGFASIVFAATRPQRTRALILNGTVPYLGFAGWDDMDRDPAELRARHLPELGEDYTPSTEQLARLQEYGRAVRAGWGSGATFSLSAPSASGRLRQLAMFERMCASPGMARASLEASFRHDVRPIHDHRANPGHPRPRGPRRSGAGRPLPRRPHPRCAVPRG